MSIAEKLTTIAENQQAVFEAGFKNHTEEHMKNCDTVGGYAYAFSGVGWNDTTYNPIRTITTKGNMNNLFYLAQITDTKVAIDVTQSTSNRNALFASASKLKTIRKIITAPNNNYSNWFNLCSRLENVIFEGEIGRSIDFSGSPLTPESMINVITHLANYKQTENEFIYTVSFREDCWEALGNSDYNVNDYIPDVLNWTEGVRYKGWNV